MNKTKNRIVVTGDIVRKYRLDRGISTYHFSRLLMVGSAYLNGYELGRHGASREFKNRFRRHIITDETPVLTVNELTYSPAKQSYSRRFYYQHL